MNEPIEFVGTPEQQAELEAAWKAEGGKGEVVAMSETTRPDIEAIEARLEAAEGGSITITVDDLLSMARANPKPVAWTVSSDVAFLLALAPADLRALLAYVRTLEGERDALRNAIENALRLMSGDPDADIPWDNVGEILESWVQGREQHMTDLDAKFEQVVQERTDSVARAMRAVSAAYAERDAQVDEVMREQVDKAIRKLEGR